MSKPCLSGWPAVRVLAVLAALIGCARVSIDSRDPIKLDVTMRLDIYQHVADEAEAIEGLVSSAGSAPASPPKQSLLWLDVDMAYAQEAGADLPQDVRSAVERRKARREELNDWEAKGVIGENSRGFAEIRDAAAASGRAGALVEEENKDRRIIYQHVAAKNGVSFEKTAEIFAQKIQQGAPSGAPLEMPDEDKWVTK